MSDFVNIIVLGGIRNWRRFPSKIVIWRFSNIFQRLTLPRIIDQVGRKRCQKKCKDVSFQLLYKFFFHFILMQLDYCINIKRWQVFCSIKIKSSVFQLLTYPSILKRLMFYSTRSFTQKIGRDCINMKWSQCSTYGKENLLIYFAYQAIFFLKSAQNISFKTVIHNFFNFVKRAYLLVSKKEYM